MAHEDQGPDEDEVPDVDDDRTGEPLSDVVVRHGRLPRRSPWTGLAKVVDIAAAVAVVSATSVTAIAVGNLRSSVQTVSIGGDEPDRRTGARAVEGAVDFVLVGSDTRKGQVAAFEGDPGSLNNDVTMLVHISADHQQMTAVSIPRDTVVDLPACLDTDTGQTRPAARGMFNTALPRGGDEGGLNCVVAAVESLTGIRAQFAGILKFDGVAAMSSAVGGVDVCIASPIHDRYVGLDLEPGIRTIEGQTASAFLRSRHGVGDGGDLGRISNQQVFLSALARKVLAPGGALSNPVTLYRLAQAALSNMIVSDNLTSVDTMVSLGLTLKGMDLSKVLFVQYPTLPNPADVNRLIVDEEPAAALDTALQTDAKTNLDDSSLGNGAAAPAPDAGGGAPSAPPSGAAGASAGASAGAPAGTSAGASAGAAAPATPSATSTALPSAITGQTAQDATCSKGNG